MKRTVTESYCVTFEVKVKPSDIPEIDRRRECARQIYNTCLGHCQKQWRHVRSIPQWRSALNELQALNRRTELSLSEKARQKALRQQLKAIEQTEGFSEYSLHAYALTINRHFGSLLGSGELQKAATFAWRTFERYRFGNAKKVRFKHRSDSSIVAIQSPLKTRPTVSVFA